MVQISEVKGTANKSYFSIVCFLTLRAQARHERIVLGIRTSGALRSWHKFSTTMFHAPPPQPRQIDTHSAAALQLPLPPPLQPSVRPNSPPTLRIPQLQTLSGPTSPECGCGHLLPWKTGSDCCENLLIYGKIATMHPVNTLFKPKHQPKHQICVSPGRRLQNVRFS
jgi:hypothetical protein